MDKFLRILETGSCGFTLDVFTSPSATKIVQWVWAAPDSSSARKNLLRVLKTEDELGLSSTDGSDFEVGLTKSMDKVSECPFQPGVCKGEHLLASGSGLA